MFSVKKCIIWKKEETRNSIYHLAFDAKNKSGTVIPKMVFDSFYIWNFNESLLNIVDERSMLIPIMTETSNLNEKTHDPYMEWNGREMTLI